MRVHYTLSPSPKPWLLGGKYFWTNWKMTPFLFYRIYAIYLVRCQVFGESFWPLLCLLNNNNNNIQVLGLCSGPRSLLIYKLHGLTHHLCAGTFQICTLNPDCFPKLQTFVPTCMTHSHLSSIVGRERKRRKRKKMEKRREVECFYSLHSTSSPP